MQGIRPPGLQDSPAVATASRYETHELNSSGSLKEDRQPAAALAERTVLSGELQSQGGHARNTQRLPDITRGDVHDCVSVQGMRS